MKPETQEWVEKAEGDFKVARRESQTADPVHEAVCFHAQQCAEKYLKAWLEEQTLAFRKTHDLVELIDLSSGQIPELAPLRTKLAHLSTFGIATRYPGVQADQLAANEALKTAEETRSILRLKLGLP